MAGTSAVPPILQNRKVQVALVVLLALWAHKKWRYSRFGAGPFPDSWQRPADQHRGYITGLHDFVDVYSQGSHEEAEDKLEAELGVHTRCYTSQLALVRYYCGRQVAEANQFADVSPTHQLRSLLAALRGPPGERAAALRNTVATQAALEQLVAGPDAGGGKQPAAKEGGAGEDGVDDDEEEEGEEGEEGELEEEEEPGGRSVHLLLRQATGTSLGAWDGVQLSQLVFRVHVHGDNIAGHTFVIAMRPDLTFDVYQSFIGQFTLHQYLRWERRALSYGEMMQFLADMQRIERAPEWTREIDGLYKKLFKVSLSRTRGYRGIKLGGGEAALAKVAGAARMAEWALGQGKAVRLAWRLVCSVPHNAKERAAELGGAPYAPFSV